MAGARRGPNRKARPSEDTHAARPQTAPSTGRLGAVPPPPERLSRLLNGRPLEEALARWNAIGGELVDSGGLRSAYLPALEQLCLAFGHLERIDLELIDLPSLTIESSHGEKSHPLLAERDKLDKSIRAGLKDFGLTPSSAASTPEMDKSSAPAEQVVKRDRSKSLIAFGTVG